MIFESEEYLMDGNNDRYSEDTYPELIQDIIWYITKFKENYNDNTTPLTDIIMDFAFRKGIAVEAVGDAIANDEYFKTFIEKEMLAESEEVDW